MPRALISVYNKSRIVDFARALHEMGWEIVSSGGTARALGEAGIPVIDVAEITGFPSILGHRVVTLHPSIHGALLADLDKSEHRNDLSRHDIVPISLAVIDLYPFSESPGIELIDVGGPAMIRAAAKNHAHVGVLIDSGQYDAVLEELRAKGALSPQTRENLAKVAFGYTSAYDAKIAQWFEGSASDSTDGEISSLELEDKVALRYGENPHQSGTLYQLVGQHGWLRTAKQLGGKELSYLNVLDADAAWRLVHFTNEPAAAVIKHANPCGFAVAGSIFDAYVKAHACDPVSAFGGIIALNREVTAEVAAEINKTFTEVVIAPSYSALAIEALAAKKNLRFIRADPPSDDSLHVRSVNGGLLVQQRDRVDDKPDTWRVVTKREPSRSELEDCLVAWKVCASVTSNAIVVVHSRQAVGIGGGQQNRVDAARIAITKAGERCAGAAAASDAFFPFSDGLEILAASGVRAIIQPGGSVRDDEVIAAADAHDIAMLITGTRHFRH
ncbi:MAG: bifunctional phosphoribosylaminoimidazolecarboxamide formyltransferase/IMP cyclohydrolase [Ilumatobacteraceae bacterium]